MIKQLSPIPLSGLSRVPVDMSEQSNSNIISLVYNNEIVGIRVIYNGKEYDINIDTVEKLNFCGIAKGVLNLHKVGDTFKTGIELNRHHDVEEISDNIDLCKKVLRMR